MQAQPAVRVGFELATDRMVKAEVRRSCITTTRDCHTTRAPSVGFELATNGFQLYSIANLDKTPR